MTVHKSSILLAFLAAIILDVTSSATFLDGRITNRMDATRGQFPFVAQIRVNTEGVTLMLCSGAILNERWALTNAICGQMSTSRVPMIVRVGAQTAHIADNDGIDHLSKRILLSADAYPGGRTGVALIELQQAIVFGSLVQPIRVGRVFMEVEQQATTLGWSSNSRKIYLQQFLVRRADEITCRVAVRAQLCVSHDFDNGGGWVSHHGWSAPTVRNGNLIGLTTGFMPGSIHWQMIRLSDYADWIDETIA